MSTTRVTEGDNEVDCEKHNVVLTGFGLFRDHQVNPSWEAIKDGQLKIDRPNINIITKQIDVAYKEVDLRVPALWKEYNPILMIHIGLAAFETRLRIEQVARHGPYIHNDVCKHAPHNDLRDYQTEGLEENIVAREYSCKPCSFEFSKTSLNLERVCDKLNEAYQQGLIRLESKISSDAGLYVCEYIYQKSLRICDRCVFIHVPNTSDNFSLEDIRLALKFAVSALIDEILSTF